MNITFKGTEIEINKCFLYDVLTMNDLFSTFTLVVEVMFNLRTFSHDIATVIKLF